MFSRWSPRSFELYLKEGLRDQGSGVELKCHPTVEASIFKGNGNMSKLAYEHLARLIPDCTLITAPAGHLVPMEAPGLTVEMIEEFHSNN